MESFKELIIAALLREDLLYYFISGVLGLIGTLFLVILPIIIQDGNKRGFVIKLGSIFVASSLFLIIIVYGLKNKPPEILLSRLREKNQQQVTVIGIFSSDYYGRDHKLGLELSLAPYVNDIELVLLDKPTLEDMGVVGPDTKKLLKELKRTILTKNVIAVVGPSVDNIDREVLKVVSSISSNIPVITESASLRSDMGWGEFDVPVLRISSGIEERGYKFSTLLSQAIEKGVKVVILVEKIPNSDFSYGQSIFRNIFKNLGEEWEVWSKNNNLVSKIEFERTKVLDIFFEKSLNREITGNVSLLNGPNLVLLLGLGLDYLPLIEKYYTNTNTGQSKILGLMNAFVTDEKLRNFEFNSARLIEITDMDISISLQNRDLVMFDRFNDRFHPFSPSIRDQAFSYDAGFIINEAWQEVKNSFPEIQSNNIFNLDIRKSFTNELADTNIMGITGMIRFAQSGAIKGQNIGGQNNKQLIYALFNQELMNWRSISIDELLNFNY